MLTTPTNESRLLGPQMQPPAATNQPPAATPASLFDLAVTKATPVFSLAWQPKASSARHRTRWRQATQQTKIERPFHRFPWLWFRDTRPTAVRRQSRRPMARLAITRQAVADIGVSDAGALGKGDGAWHGRWHGDGGWSIMGRWYIHYGVGRWHIHYGCGSMAYSLWCGSMAITSSPFALSSVSETYLPSSSSCRPPKQQNNPKSDSIASHHLGGRITGAICCLQPPWQLDCRSLPRRVPCPATAAPKAKKKPV